jgi:uncharacterized repeat protein (TIGR03847 family)
MTYEFQDVDRFICGTVGEPGEREFYLQVRIGNRLLSATLEKSQAATLAQRLEILLRQIVKEDVSIVIERSVRDDAPLEQPIEADFTVGAISIAFDESNKKVCLELFAIKEVESVEDEAEIRMYLALAQAKAFVTRTLAVVNAGRLPCPFCAIPIDPRGHLCPRANGYRR